MGKKIVISFPGGRGSEIPLLYFAAKHYEDLGYEKRFINHPAYGEECLEVLMENAEKVLQSIAFEEYEDIIFVAKSIGTLVACRLKEKCNVSASLILFTPLEDTLPYINSENNILLVSAGDKDRYLEAGTLKELCEKEKINYYIEPNVGHRMEVLNDLRRNLEIVYNVVGRLE